MRPGTQIKVLVAVVFLAFNLGCAQDYLGTLSVQGFSELHNVEELPVRVRVSQAKNGFQATATVQDLSGESMIEPLQIRRSKRGGYFLEVPDLKTIPFLMKKVSNEPECYSAKRDYSVEFCKNTFQFTLTIQKASAQIRVIGARNAFDDKKAIDADSFAKPFPIPVDLIKDQQFTLSEAIDRISTDNFTVRESIQTVLRSFESSSRAYFDLLPHFNLGTGLSLFGSLVKPKGALGDLVPFLFPTRWMTAKSSVWQWKAETVGLSILKANKILALQTHTLLMNAHWEVRRELTLLKTQLERAYVLAEAQRAEGRADEHSLLTIEIALNDLKVRLRHVNMKYNLERLELSLLLGFRNPIAVERVILGDETTRADAIPRFEIDELMRQMETLSELAVAQSLELPQVSFLYRSAKLNAADVFVNWLDVSSSKDMGFNLIPEYRIAQSELRSLGIRRQEIEASVKSKTYSHLFHRNALKETYMDYEDSLKSRKKRLEILFQQIEDLAANRSGSGETFKTVANELRGATKDGVSGLESYYHTQSALEIENAGLARMLLTPPYDRILPKI